MHEPNIPLLRKMVEWVEEQDQLTENREWYQGNWVAVDLNGMPVNWWADWEQAAGLHKVDYCGTAYCVAGKVAEMHGWESVEGSSRIYNKATGAFSGVGTVARELLGLTETQSHLLFAASNTAADIRRVAETIAGEKL